MDYACSNSNAQIVFQASDMILQTDSDAVYHVAEKECCQAAGYHYYGNPDGKEFNVQIHVLAKIIE